MKSDSEKIKYPLEEDQKDYFRKRLEEVLNQKNGLQVIILWDKNKLTDYYQNLCLKYLLKCVKKSATDYSKITNNKLLRIHK